MLSFLLGVELSVTSIIVTTMDRELLIHFIYLTDANLAKTLGSGHIA